MLGACANIGNPSGGPRDEDPPRLIRANPPQGALNVSKPQMTLTFNELVNVKDAFSKVVLSPSGRSPRITPVGKNVQIRFDSLAPNTTYTIDFADAIEDNNEANKLQNFAYTFSTGPTIDTLRISGRVLGSSNLEPRPGIIVGVHENLSDTAFTGIPLLRVAKTDDRGRFVIRGLAPGNYRVFALDDRDADFKYSSDDEEIAFYDVPVTPTSTRVEALDTIYDVKTGTIDSVATRMRTRYYPDDVLLRSFVAKRRNQYVRQSERVDSGRLLIKMAVPQRELPRLSLLGDTARIPAILESRRDCDSITVWLPPQLAARDTLPVTVRYTRMERGKQPVEVTDTLKMITKKQPARKRKKPKKTTHADSLARISFGYKLISASPQEVYRPLELESPTPVARLDTTMIHLEMKTDTVWHKAPKAIRVSSPDTLAPRTLRIDYPWDYGAQYRLQIDSLAATDIYGRTSMPLKLDVPVRKAEDYCSLTLDIIGASPGVPAFVEILDGSDKVMRTADVQEGRAFIPFLASGKYYARIIEDYNGNGVYDPGDYAAGVQPDLAYYYPKAINIKKNWDKKETWDIFSTAIDEQKPRAVLKNKPKSNNKGRNNTPEQEYDEDEDEPFDPTANPFEQKRKKGSTRR